MKKILTTIALVIAMCGATYANDANFGCNNDTVVVSERTSELIRTIADAGNVGNFYNIEKIVIDNPKHANISIYDSNWNLIYQSSNEKIVLRITAGDYHIVSDAPLKQKYLYTA